MNIFDDEDVAIFHSSWVSIFKTISYWNICMVYAYRSNFQSTVAFIMVTNV